MKQSHREKITSILEDIKSRSSLIGGGRGEGERREFRDVHTIWDLGIAIKNALDDAEVPDDRKNEQVRKIVIKFDYEILGKQNDWSSYAYEWVTNFQDKNYYLKICKYAGYREDDAKNRFRKRDLRYLVPIFTKISESSFSDAKRNKLEKELDDESILKYGAHDFQKFLVKAKGKEYTPWSDIRESLQDLHLTVDSITDKLEERVEERKKFREELGETLISQISAALQLCVIKNESDYNYAYDLVKKQEFNKKSKSQNEELLNLLENLKVLLKDSKTKNKLLQKSDYYEYEQLASKLDAIKNEDDFKDFFNRKKAITDIFG
jgi:SOS-response transcriptional repressor LexA